MIVSKIFDKYTNDLNRTLLRGYRKQIGGTMKDEGFIPGMSEYKQTLKEKSEKRTKKHINKLSKYISELE